MSGDVDQDLRTLMHKVWHARGFPCDAYKPNCLRRRLAVRMRARGVTTYAEYGAVLDRDAGEVNRLVDTLTINVSAFYRNRETWDALAQVYLPRLWRRRRGVVRCWSAGCAAGEEPYTLAMLLLEQDAVRGRPAPPGPRVLATDIDDRSLAAAKRGEYRRRAVEDLPGRLTSRYLEPGGGDGRARIAGAVRSIVRFERHNLAVDAPPRPPYDVVVCRNVVIYFDRGAQRRVFRHLVDSLAPGGILVLGKTETLHGVPVRDRLALDNVAERVYVRV